MARTACKGLVVALLATVLALVADPAEAYSPRTNDEQYFVDRINAERAATGRGALAHDGDLSRIARAWAQEMANRGAVSHNPNWGTEVQAAMSIRSGGENVGKGGSTRDSMHRSFMGSAPHRANILGAYNRVGVGLVRTADAFYVVQLFVQSTYAPRPASTWAPYRNVDLLVDQQYLDFFARGPDPRGMGSWTHQLNRGATTPKAVIANFLSSREFSGAVAPVARLLLGIYAGIGDGIPPTAQFTQRIAEHRFGMSLAAIANDLGDQVAESYPQAGDEAFVRAVYQELLGRQPSGDELKLWTDALPGPTTRAEVVLGVSGTGEYAARHDLRVKVAMIYVGMLRRAPDPAGLDHWVGEASAGRPLQDLIHGFLASAEYRNRVQALPLS